MDEENRKYQARVKIIIAIVLTMIITSIGIIFEKNL